MLSQYSSSELPKSITSFMKEDNIKRTTSPFQKDNLGRPNSPFQRDDLKEDLHNNLVLELSSNSEDNISLTNIDELNKTYLSAFFETITLNHYTVNLVAKEINNHVFFMVFEKCDGLHKSKNLMYFHRIVTSEKPNKLKEKFADKKDFITLLPRKVQLALESKYCNNINTERFVYLE